MGKLQSILSGFGLGRKSQDVPQEVRSGNSSLTYPQQWLMEALSIRGIMNGRGVSVSPHQALGISALFACVRKLSTDLASLPLEIHANKNGTKSIDYKHVSYNLVHREPNPRDNAMDFWRTVLAHSFLQGQGIALIIRDKNAKPTRLIHVKKQDIKVYKSLADDLVYIYKHKDYGDFMEYDVLRVNGFLGIDVVHTFNNLLGISVSAEDYAAAYFANGNNVQGYLSSEGKLTVDQISVVKESWTGPGSSDNAHGTSLLPFNMKYNELKGKSPQDTQLSEVRKEQGAEICRIFGIPPGLIGFETAAKYESVEGQNLFYVTNVLRPAAKVVEQECDRKLLLEIEKSQGTHSFKYNFNALLRGDTKTRGEFYDRMVKIGAFSINDVREHEGLNSVEGGDHRYVQVNQIPIEFMDDYAKKLVENPTATTKV